jgi:tetratricopeptide (TPR) repeat protein
MLDLGRGNFEAASVALAQYVAESPWDADALTYLGAAHYQLGRFEEARARWLRALEMHPTAARHKLLGDVAYGLRKFPEAVDHYTRALTLDAGNAAAKCNRGLARQALETAPAQWKTSTERWRRRTTFARAQLPRHRWLERATSTAP